MALPQVLRSLPIALATTALALTVPAAAATATTPSAKRHAHAARHHHHRKHVRRAHRTTRRVARASTTSAPALTFGIYPGGPAGAVGPSGPLRPEDPSKRLSMLEQLRPAGHPFVLHLYAGYGGPGSSSAAAQVGSQIASYEAAGFQLELALCYRSTDVQGFVAWTRQAVADLGSNPGFVSLQVTNEANIKGAPNASDGYYPGAEDALIQGVEAAKDQARRAGFGQVKIGFNWAYGTGSSEKAFWSYIGSHGGSAFLGSLDWVGVDSYPGTWGPSLASDLDLAAGVRQAMSNALSSLRKTYMPLAHIAAAVPIHFSENGYPTGPGRSYDAQTIVLRAAVQAAWDYRGTYNVSDYRWFDLRDSNTASPYFEDQYGLTTDSYAPKPAFAVYRTLLASL